MSIPTTNLIDRWNFDTEVLTGTRSGVVNNTSLLDTNGNVVSAIGKFRRGCVFSATNQTALSAALSQFSLATKISGAFWYYRANASLQRMSVGTVALAAHRCHCLVHTDGKCYVTASNGSSVFGSVNHTTADVWTHYSWVFDGTFTDANTAIQNAGRLKLYINAVQQTLSFTGTVPAALGSTANQGAFRCGFDASSGSVWSDGLLDELVLANTAWTAAEISNIYNFIPRRTMRVGIGVKLGL